jgi:hypothetical protein
MLPIYAGEACAAFLFARGVLGIGLGGDARGNLARVARGWLPAAVVALAVAIACQVALPRLGREQHNFAELLRADRLFPAAWLVALCLWVPATAGWAASDWSAGRRLSAAAWAPAGLLVSWGLLRCSVTVESIDDVLGSPTTGWPLDIEYVARLAAVYFPFAWVPLLIPPLATRSRAGAACCAAVSAAVVLASRAVVRGYSHADNVSELFRPGGECLFGAGCLAAGWAAMLCARAGAVRGAVLAVALSVPAWWVANMSVRVESVHGVSAGFAAFCAVFVFFALCAAPGMRAGQPEGKALMPAGFEATGAILARVEASMDAQDKREYDE